MVVRRTKFCRFHHAVHLTVMPRTTSRAAVVVVLLVVALSAEACCGPCMAPCNPFAKRDASVAVISSDVLSKLMLGQRVSEVEASLGSPSLHFTAYCTNVSNPALAYEYDLTDGRSAVVLFNKNRALTYAYVTTVSGQKTPILGDDPCVIVAGRDSVTP